MNGVRYHVVWSLVPRARGKGRVRTIRGELTTGHYSPRFQVSLSLAPFSHGITILLPTRSVAPREGKELGTPSRDGEQWGLTTTRLKFFGLIEAHHDREVLLYFIY